MTNRSELHELFLLIKNLRETIFATGEAIVNGIGDQVKTAKETSEKQPPGRITVDLQAPSEQTNRYYTEHDKSYRLQRWTFWVQVALCVFTAAAFGAAAYYASVAREQSRTMNSTLKEVEKQSKAAIDSAAAAQEANRLTRESIRGRVTRINTSIMPVEAGKPVSVITQWKNVGHNPVLASIGIDVKRWRGMPSGEMPIKMAEAESFAADAVGTLDFTDMKPLTENYIDHLPGPSSTVPLEEFETTYFFGRIEYITVGEKHSLEVCAYLTKINEPTFEAFKKAEASVATISGKHITLRQCPKWHEEK